MFLSLMLLAQLDLSQIPPPGPPGINKNAMELAVKEHNDRECRDACNTAYQTANVCNCEDYRCSPRAYASCIEYRDYGQKSEVCRQAANVCEKYATAPIEP